MRVSTKTIGLSALVSALSAPSAQAEQLSFFGTPGLVDMPTAGRLDDGNLAFTTANYGPIWRNTLTFQITPRITGAFRYSAQGEYLGPDSALYDRSFDLHFLLREEGDRWPSVALGVRDFGGTGVYSGEYIVVSKYIAPNIQLTGGIGWGRFAGRGGLPNPIGILDNRFKTRPARTTRTGEFGFDQWFRGDAAFFGGIKWNATDRLMFIAEYSSDTYERESRFSIDPQSSPYNFGVSYKFRNSVDLGAYYLYGNKVGLRFSYVIDPAGPRAPGGQETAPPALLPRTSVAAQSWNLPDPARRAVVVRDSLQARLAEQGIRLVGYEVDDRAASVRIENQRFGATAQAVGRTARVMANTFASNIEEFEVTFVVGGMNHTTVAVNRTDLEELENDLEGAWHSLARAEISDAFGIGRAGTLSGAYPRFIWGISPYTAFSLFDPDEPVRYELGVQLNAAWEPRPGLIFSGQLRKGLASNIDDTSRTSDSALPHVRSDTVLYARQSDAKLTHLTGAYFFRPRENMFGRLTAGYLEPMFGGVSAELLWYPLNSRLALGAEINYAVQRDYDQRFGFQDYDVVTGHFSAYFDFGRGYHGQIDIGRYLAGDWGATLTVDRQFKNGFKVGAFATFTDVSYVDFGEGSFDKGIFVQVPVSWITGQPNRNTISQTIRPIVRDGGARLNLRNRLYGLVEPYRGRKVADSWGKYLR